MILIARAIKHNLLDTFFQSAPCHLLAHQFGPVERLGAGQLLAQVRVETRRGCDRLPLAVVVDLSVSMLFATEDVQAWTCRFAKNVLAHILASSLPRERRGIRLFHQSCSRIIWPCRPCQPCQPCGARLRSRNECL